MSILADLVGLLQGSFIPRRATLDNIVVAQEALHSIKGLKGRRCIVAFKIDLEKAYGRVD